MTLEKKTKRLIIRQLQTSDYAAWKQAHIEMFSPQNRWDTSADQKSKYDRKEFLQVRKRSAERAELDQSYKFFVFLKSNGKLIGFISAMDIVRSVSHTAILGYAIYNNHWGQGYAKEAISGFFDLAFRELKLHRLEAGIEPHNRRSIMLARSLGMRKEGLKKRAVYLRGDWQDLSIYSITSEELGIMWKPPR